MICSGLASSTGHAHAAQATAVMAHAHLANVVRLSGIGVSVAGAFEAAPDGAVRFFTWLYRWARRQLRSARALLARWLPFLRSDAEVRGVTAEGRVTAPVGFSISAVGEAWHPNATTREQARALWEMHQALSRRVTDVQREARESTEAVRRELRQAAEELRAAGNQITVRIDTTEKRGAQADARGIVVVVAGIVMSGIPAGLARWLPLGIAAIAAGCASAIWVGYLVTRSARARQTGTGE